MSKSANVKVYCRIRPENEKEKQSGMKICITASSEKSVKIFTESVGVDTGKESSKNKTENFQTFTYDEVFPPETEQEKIFNIVAKPLINSALEGINSTLFCYGQTASGKTYTMEGIHNDPKIMGVIPRMMQYIFILIEKASSEIEYSVKCQYYQIYNEKIQDLLDIRKKDLAIREDKNKGIWVEDCTEIYVSSQEEMYTVFKEGSNNRTVSATNMNKGSSRSHSLFVVTLFQRNIITGSSKTGKMYFVDLAGSEKMSKTGIESGTGLKEAQNINKSLMTLGMVINSLTEGAKHIPYRDSKLTRVLQESIGGNSMTNLVITCSPNYMNQNETLSTLRFGQRAKLIKNKVVANTQQSVKELLIKLKKAEEKIAMLEKVIQDKNVDIQSMDKKRGNKSDKIYKCEECKLITAQLNYVKNELINTMNENDELTKYKEELCEEVKNKNEEIVKLNDIIQNKEFQLQGYKEENSNYYNEIKKYIEIIMNQNKEMKTAIKNRDISIIEKSFNINYKTNCHLIDKLGLPINFDFDFEIKNNVINDNKMELNINKNNNDISITNDLNKSFNHRNINFINNIHIGLKPSNGKKSLNKSFLITTIRNKPLFQLLIKDNNSHNTTIIKQKKYNNNDISRTHILTQEEEDSISQNLEISRKENEVLRKKQAELEYIIKALNQKLFEKDDKFQKYKEKSLQDLAFKEKKLQNLANLIGDLEDENYRLKHMNKDNMTKAKIIMMEKQITTFAIEFQKKDERNKALETKTKQQEAQINNLITENKMLQNNLDFFSNNFNNLAKNNNDIFSSRNSNDFFGGDQNERNWLRNSTSIFDGLSFYDGESVLDQSFRFQRNKMMKFIKGGTKVNGGFFSKIMDNNMNRKDTYKIIHDFKGQTLNNKDFKIEQLENQLKQLDKDVLNETQSEFN